jgi:hypothetical protein
MSAASLSGTPFLAEDPGSAEEKGSYSAPFLPPGPNLPLSSQTRPHQGTLTYRRKHAHHHKHRMQNGKTTARHYVTPHYGDSN